MTATMVPERDVLGGRPTELIRADGRPTPAFREQLRRIPSWRNAGSGQQYTVTPTRTYGASSDQCRDFTTVTEIEGRQEVVHGFACKQADGTWKVS